MRVIRRPPQGGALACSFACAVALSACGLNQQGVPPPLDHISFPGSALVDPDGQWLYVANSNSDLRYNNGTLVAVDLAAAAADRNPATHDWKVCQDGDYIYTGTADQLPADHYCCWDYLDHTILDCDERNYVNPASTAIIGSFAAGMVFQPFEPSCSNALPTTITTRSECNACPVMPKAGRLFIGVRGNSSITYVDTSRAITDGKPRFTCPDATGAGASCVVDQMDNTTPLGTTAAPVLLPDEPYALLLDNTSELLYVGHLRGDTAHASTGGISLLDVSTSTFTSPSASKPIYLGPSGSFFPPDGNGNFGITTLNRNPNNGLVYASSRYTTSALGIVAVPPPGPPACGTLNGSYFVEGSSDVFTSPLVGAEIRGIQFGPEANRAYMLQRTPPALIGFDLANGNGGVFGNVSTDVLETCQSPTFLQRNQSGDDLDADDPNLYVTCFDSGQVYVFDPSVPRLTNVIEVGGGPAGLAFAKVPPAGETKKLAYVVGFLENNISVVDVTPNSETRFHVIQRIGFPSLTPR